MHTYISAAQFSTGRRTLRNFYDAHTVVNHILQRAVLSSFYSGVEFKSSSRAISKSSDGSFLPQTRVHLLPIKYTFVNNECGARIFKACFVNCKSLSGS
ncbi:hypothetical protein CEXT_392531 [Caerostris extrusa]|uniref:Uncharacterized protein n=1 Tax=Caerostris extrusa TaxID=172846 RepID=A0AAV4WHZ7_CAEEX|nr:hypothetical protein CEXT_392531 [Caerostris extrusa]